jgi:hypothetical protein
MLSAGDGVVCPTLCQSGLAEPLLWTAGLRSGEDETVYAAPRVS